MKELLAEAGFRDIHVYWENDDEEYERAEEGEAHASWIAYVVARK